MSAPSNPAPPAAEKAATSKKRRNPKKSFDESSKPLRLAAVEGGTASSNPTSPIEATGTNTPTAGASESHKIEKESLKDVAK